MTAILLVRSQAAFEQTQAGARALGMGGAAAALSDESSVLLYNPAGLGFLRQNHATFAFSKLLAGISDGSNLTSAFVSYANPVGRYGTPALSFSQLNLSGFYTERVFAFGYGIRPVREFSAGFTAKLLQQKFSGGQISDARDNSGLATGGADPVFASRTGKSGVALDLGLQYAFGPRYAIGFSAENLLSPNLGLAEAQKPPTALRFGFAAKPKDMIASLEVMRRVPDWRVTGAYEAFLTPAFGLRLGLSLGSRELRAFSTGLSFRQKPIQVDYAFSLPMGGLRSFFGSHRISLSTRFGPWPAGPKHAFADWEEERPLASTAALAPGIAEPTPEQKEEAEKNLRIARDAYTKGLYVRALEHLRTAQQHHPRHKVVEALVPRLELAADSLVQETRPDRQGKLIRRGVAMFIENRSLPLAYEFLVYAVQRDPTDTRISPILAAMRREMPDLESLRLVPGMTLVEQRLQEALEDWYAGRYVSMASRCNSVLELEPDNLLALTRLGSAYWSMGQREKATEAWSRALEVDPANREITAFLRQEGISAATQARPGAVGPSPSLPGLQRSTAAAPSPTTASAMRTYTVVKGDTLPKISEKVYGDAGRWREIYEANRDILKNPYALFVNQVLKIP